MKISDKGIELIKEFEGCELTVYKDVAGLNTVGYGHRTDKPVGDKISRGMADQLLQADVEHFSYEVEQLVTVPLSQNQFDALVSFTYNVGVAALTRSTLLKQLNAEKYKDAANSLLAWSKAGGKQSKGLLRRRNAERDLFLS